MKVYVISRDFEDPSWSRGTDNCNSIFGVCSSIEFAKDKLKIIISRAVQEYMHQYEDAKISIRVYSEKTIEITVKGIDVDITDTYGFDEYELDNFKDL